MSWFNNLKISSKIISIVLAIMTLMLLLGAIAIFELSKVNGSTEEIATNWLPSVHAVDSIDGTISDYRRQELQYILSTKQEDWDLFTKKMSEVESELKLLEADYVKLISSPEEKKLYEEYRTHWVAYLESVKKEIALTSENRHEEALALCRGETKKSFLAAMAALDKDALLNKKGSDDAFASAKAVYSQARIMICTVIVAALVAGLLLALLVAGIISRSLKKGVAVAEKLAQGDLSVTIEVDSRDETGQLMAAMRTMTENLRKIIGQVASTATQVASAANQLHSTADRIATGAEEVAAQSGTVATAGEEMSATSGDIAQSCQMAATGALRASQSAQNGAGVVESTVRSWGRSRKRCRRPPRPSKAWEPAPTRSATSSAPSRTLPIRPTYWP